MNLDMWLEKKKLSLYIGWVENNNDLFVELIFCKELLKRKVNYKLENSLIWCFKNLMWVIRGWNLLREFSELFVFIERFILCLLFYFLIFYIYLKNILIYFLFIVLVDCYIKEFFLFNICILM